MREFGWEFSISIGGDQFYLRTEGTTALARLFSPFGCTSLYSKE
jgi:hypothetical protein